MTLSTIYRILDTFCKAGILSLVCHPGTGKCYYDICVTEHHHVFDEREIMDYMDPELTDDKGLFAAPAFCPGGDRKDTSSDYPE